MSKMSDALVVATLKKLVEKIQKFDKQQFITDIVYKDSALEVEFRNGFKQKFIISHNNKDNTLDINKQIDEILVKYKRLAAKYNKITENKELKKEFRKLLLTHKKDFIKKLEGYHQSLERVEKKLAEDLKNKLDTELSKIEVKDGQDGKDADNEAIIKSLQEFILKNMPKPQDGRDGRDAVIDLDSLKRELEDYIKANIPQIKDGKDGEVDYDKIEALIRDLFLGFKKNSEEVLQKAINAIVVPVAKDGKDGRDADEGAILATLKEELQSILNQYLEEKNNAISLALTDYEQKLEQSVPIIIEKYVTKIPRPKDGKDGVDGRDGRDSDSDEILKTLNEKVISLANNTAGNLQEQVNIAVAELIRIAEKTKGKKGDKGDKGESIKGDKGDRGNSVKSAEIDQLGDLIITTDDKTINAGRVSIKNFYGGSGGGGSESVSYTNSKPMPFKLGGLPKGTRFKNTNFKTLMTKLLYGVELPYFSTFSIQKQGGAEFIKTIEIGYSLISETLSVAYSIENDLLLEADSIILLQDNEVVVEKVSGSPFEFQSLGVTYNVPQNVDFTILAYDTTGTSFQSVITLGFKYKIYYGEYTDDIMDWVSDSNTNPLSILRAKELALDIYGEYFFLGVGYKWFCYPESLGENYVFYEISSDIALIFDEVRKITITNEYGLKLKYNCYRSLYEIHEEFVMGVK